MIDIRLRGLWDRKKIRGRGDVIVTRKLDTISI